MVNGAIGVAFLATPMWAAQPVTAHRGDLMVMSLLYWVLSVVRTILSRQWLLGRGGSIRTAINSAWERPIALASTVRGRSMYHWRSVALPCPSADVVPADFIRANLGIALNVIHEAYGAGVQRLLFLGSSCIFPRLAPQPIPEDALLTGPLEPTNEAYAVAKIAGLKLCQHYRAQYGVTYHSVMPTNLYGPGDNYDPMNAHVLPALLRRFHEAREQGAPQINIWGSGTPRREFLYVDDCADAIIRLLQEPEPPDWVNVGMGEDVTIRELAEIVRDVVGCCHAS